MKRDNIKNSKNETKLRIEDIKKNSSSDVMHCIKKIKERETKITVLLVGVILCFVGLFGYFMFSSFNDTNFDEVKSGPLMVKFSENANGMSDIINFTGFESNIGTENNVVVNTEFTVTNNSYSSSWYAVYLDDYVDMINFDGCQEKQLDKDDLYFSIDNSEPIQLSSVDYGGRYVITEGVISANTVTTHNIQVWHMNDTEKHYHGKIVVKYLR